jgi:plasmid stabilization system protein ParE
MNTYRLTKRADQNLRSIWRKVASDSPAGADRLLELIHQSIRFLAANPISGEKWSDGPAKMRCHPVPGTDYLIFFVPTSFGVRIAHVIHGGRDLSAILPSYTSRGQQ